MKKEIMIIHGIRSIMGDNRKCGVFEQIVNVMLVNGIIFKAVRIINEYIYL